MIDRHEEVKGTVDHLFRHHAGQMVSTLSHAFGVRHLELVEDAVQEAMVTALKKWPFGEMPQNPRAWLIEVAKNRVLDRLRRDARSSSIDEEFDLPDVAAGGVYTRFESEFGEDQLKMIFACCHPAIARDSQVALTLKIVGGFSVAEIARAYLAKDESIAKLLTRAKQKLRSGGVPLEIPAGPDLSNRLDAVLKVLYLMFNEGHSATGGDDLTREDLCFEAIRLCEMLCRHPVTGMPKVHAAAALFLFQGSRLRARTGRSGELVLLEDQDRSLWDRELIGRGLEHFRQSASGGEISNFHLEAEIAALYLLSAGPEAIDWEHILECYDRLQRRHFSKVAELNRIIALGKARGPAAALLELDRLAGEHDMQNYNLFHIACGHFLLTLGQDHSARNAYSRALELTRNSAVREFIAGRLKRLTPTA
jgi:RNA polymerase sigma-70 factor (ECF subfamily)